MSVEEKRNAIACLFQLAEDEGVSQESLYKILEKAVELRFLNYYDVRNIQIFREYFDLEKNKETSKIERLYLVSQKYGISDAAINSILCTAKKHKKSTN